MSREITWVARMTIEYWQWKGSCEPGYLRHDVGIIHYPVASGIKIIRERRGGIRALKCALPYTRLTIRIVRHGNDLPLIAWPDQLHRCTSLHRVRWRTFPLRGLAP